MTHSQLIMILKATWSEVRWGDSKSATTKSLQAKSVYSQKKSKKCSLLMRLLREEPPKTKLDVNGAESKPCFIRHNSPVLRVGGQVDPTKTPLLIYFLIYILKLRSKI
jgi:hypothetical protein